MNEVRSIGAGQASQLQKMAAPQPSIVDRGTEVSQILFDTRDPSGLSDRTFQVLQKDWTRFTQACNGQEQPPLPMEEANNDLFDYVGYMMKYGDKVKIGSTASDMKTIMSDCVGDAKNSCGGDNFKFVSNLAHNLSQDPRIPNDYCFLRQPAEEFQNSAYAEMQATLQEAQKGQ